MGVGRICTAFIS